MFSYGLPQQESVPFGLRPLPPVFVFKSMFLFVDACFYLLSNIRLVVGEVKDILFGNDSIHTVNVVCYCFCCLVQLQVMKKKMLPSVRKKQPFSVSALSSVHCNTVLGWGLFDLSAVLYVGIRNTVE